MLLEFPKIGIAGNVMYIFFFNWMLETYDFEGLNVS